MNINDKILYKIIESLTDKELLSKYKLLYNINPLKGFEKFLYTEIYSSIGAKIIEIPEFKDFEFIFKNLKIGGGRFIDFDCNCVISNVFKEIYKNEDKEIKEYIENILNKEIDCIVSVKIPHEEKICKNIYFIEIKGPSTYSYILSGAESINSSNYLFSNQKIKEKLEKNHQDKLLNVCRILYLNEQKFTKLLDELLESYHKISNKRHKIGRDSLFGDVFKLINLISFWKCFCSKMKFYGICFGYILKEGLKKGKLDTICQIFPAMISSLNNFSNSFAKFKIRSHLYNCDTFVVLVVIITITNKHQLNFDKKTIFCY